ncbi:hypothetical protein Syun_021196 [Stephania yunnanensis]|uniref:NAC domain-containing protein n=1 Tax=Stephania yunnanensis TaxID=152371 RepID=A0AAP0NQH1_9MAGN
MALYSSNHVGGLSSHDFRSGYVFAPTELELLGHFLLLKTQNPSIQFDEIHDPGNIDPGNIYESAPDTLTEREQKRGTFSARGSRNMRKDYGRVEPLGINMDAGRPQGGEKKLKDKNGNLLGKKQTLTYYAGKKNSIKTYWIMQEFIFTSDDKKVWF